MRSLRLNPPVSGFVRSAAASTSYFGTFLEAPTAEFAEPGAPGLSTPVILVTAKGDGHHRLVCSRGSTLGSSTGGQAGSLLSGGLRACGSLVAAL